MNATETPAFDYNELQTLITRVDDMRYHAIHGDGLTEHWKLLYSKHRNPSNQQIANHFDGVTIKTKVDSRTWMINIMKFMYIGPGRPLIGNTYQWLHEINTNSGKVYFQTNGNVKFPVITVYTAHFFDRFALRTGMAETILGAKKVREESIYKFMSTKMSPRFTNQMYKRNGEIAVGTEFGLCLGVNHKNMFLFKTFVSADMLREKQSEIAKETTIPLFEMFDFFKQNKVGCDINEKTGAIIKKPEPGRNDQCGCRSGKKYKKCCINPMQPSSTLSDLSSLVSARQ